MDLLNRIKKVASDLRPKTACITSYGTWDVPGLVKIRDRNYIPDIEIIHDVKNDVEICYLFDHVTGWCEGINEYGIGIVNTALAVGRDESEKTIVKQVGKKSDDGEKLLKALACKTLAKARDSIQTYKGGLQGHTFIANDKEGYSVELINKKMSDVMELVSSKKYVRTNHGLTFYDSGYTEGEKLISSLCRRERALDLIHDVDKLSEIPIEMLRRRREDKSHPNNMIRDTKRMWTTSQMILNLKDFTLSLYLIPDKVKFRGITNNLDRKPKIKVKVFDYKNYKTDSIKTIPNKKASVFLNEVNRQLTSFNETEYAHKPHIDEDAFIFKYNCSGFVNYALEKSLPNAYENLRDFAKRTPKAKHYVSFLQQDVLPKSWLKINKIKDLQKGDLIAWVIPEGSDSRNTGHVMVVLGLPYENPKDPHEYIIPVIDSTNLPHLPGDSRDGSGSGLGIGEIVLVVDKDDYPEAFRWSKGSKSSVYNTIIVMGRVV